MKVEFNRFKRRINAFTLIELLVVIAIMAILSSMLFPSFTRAREMARRASCSSNMKQLGLGFQQYLQDYDGRYPGAGQWQRWASGGHWVAGASNGFPSALAGLTSPFTKSGQQADIMKGALYTYTKSEQIYVCPSSRDGRETKLSYSMNCALSDTLADSVENQTSVVQLVDEAYPSDGFFYAVNSVDATDQMTQIHNGGGNLLFCDGHVKFFPFKAYPIGDVSADSNYGAFRVRIDGQPRFFDSQAAKDRAMATTNVSVFGDCATP